MKCEEVQELITALVDEEIPEAERLSLQGHLHDCPRCQLAYRQEQVLKREIRLTGEKVSAPANLREKIVSALSSFRQGEELRQTWREWITPARLSLRPAFILALLILLALPIYMLMPQRESIALSSLEVHEKILQRELLLIKSENEKEIKEQLLRSVAGDFAPMGYDLSTANLWVVGGVVQEIARRKVLVTVYEGKSLSLTCFTFLGKEDDAPKNASLFYDPEKKLNFYLFSRHGINGVLHREGKVICILVSKMPMQDLLAIARSKAQSS